MSTKKAHTKERDAKKDFFTNIGISFSVALIIILLRVSGFLMYMELSAYDLYLRYFSGQFKPENNVVVITVSEDDIAWLNNLDEEEGGKYKQWKTTWPMNDGIIADLLNLLLDEGPRVVGLDIYRDQKVEPGTERLLELFSLPPNEQGIVTIRKFGDSKEPGINPMHAITTNIENGVIPAHSIHEIVGFNDLMFDPDGIVRRGILAGSFVEKKKSKKQVNAALENFYSFSTMIANKYLAFEEKPILFEEDPVTHEKKPISFEASPVYYCYNNKTHKVELVDFKSGKNLNVSFKRLEKNSGAYVGIDDSGYQMLLDYRGGQELFKSFSIKDVITKKLPEDALYDKVVMIGMIADSSNDFFFTPFSKASQDQSKMPGVYVHGNLVSQLIRSAKGKSQPMYYIEDGYEWCWIFVWSLIGGTLVVLMTSPILLTLAIGLVFVFLVIFTYIIFTLGCWLPFVPPVLSFFLSAFFRIYFVSSQEKVQKAQLMQLFSRHVSSDVASELWENRDEFMDGNRPKPKRLTATIIFTDLAGFTAISENMDPDILMEWLNGYMSRMARVITKHHGVIDKFIGDAIMAVFGIPVPRTTDEEIRQDAMNAVKCVIEMGKELDRLNIELAETGMPTIKMRVGVYTGMVVAGSLGSEERVEYTVLGDTVNTASRLESLKGSEELNVIEGSIRIIIGPPTKDLVGENFEYEEIGGIYLKGKEGPQTVYKIKTD